MAEVQEKEEERLEMNLKKQSPHMQSLDGNVKDLNLSPWGNMKPLWTSKNWPMDV